MESRGLIGLDGGASKVSGYNVIVNKENTFSLGELHEDILYESMPGFIKGFTPVPLVQQCKERDEGNVRIAPEEMEQGEVLVKAVIEVVRRLANLGRWEEVLIGIGMPGIKTLDKRGILVFANGPRILDFSEKVEKGLAKAGLKMVSPISHLASDADLCAIGEEHAKGGLFHGVNYAYYIGPGTGVADAMKLDGKILPFDQAKSWIAKTWEMKERDGRNLEDSISMRGISTTYKLIKGEDGTTIEEIARRAKYGEAQAKETLQKTSKIMAVLLEERITTLALGWTGKLDMVYAKREPLSNHHPYLGKFWERIVFGQRFGAFLSTDLGKDLLLSIEHDLALLLTQNESLGYLRSFYLKESNKIRENLICISLLRESPALGAGIDAYIRYRK